MKESNKEGKCDIHNQTAIKIQTNSRRMLCDKCIAENQEQRRQRLEIQRLKLQKAYQIEFAELKETKKQTDKLVELFQTKNMTEAKKIINRSSQDAQKIVQTLLETELKQANKLLKETAENELERWKDIDGRTFTASYLQFQSETPKIELKLQELKQNLKQKIAEKLKQEMRSFYCNLLEI